MSCHQCISIAAKGPYVPLHAIMCRTQHGSRADREMGSGLSWTDPPSITSSLQGRRIQIVLPPVFIQTHLSTTGRTHTCVTPRTAIDKCNIEWNVCMIPGHGASLIQPREREIGRQPKRIHTHSVARPQIPSRTQVEKKESVREGVSAVATTSQTEPTTILRDAGRRCIHVDIPTLSDRI